MRTLKLTLAYDGTNYVGWQRQINGVSIQQLIEEALQPLVGVHVPLPTVVGAGRTDAGVHALAQIASVQVDFAVPVAAVGRALNVRLPVDIRVLDVADAAPRFHAQFDAKGKCYRYRMATARVQSPFGRWFAWHAPEPRDVAAMREGAARLLGRHDFLSFQASGSASVDSVRTIERIDVVQEDDAIVIEVEGEGFLRHMVRIIVGTLSEVGSGRRRPDGMTAVLEARNRRAAGLTAPACGLTLVRVRY
ncbi:MAG: tRNA pseudouridine(38-40) synthase TruA [Acidobacteriota bacterium]